MRLSFPKTANLTPYIFVFIQLVLETFVDYWFISMRGVVKVKNYDRDPKKNSGKKEDYAELTNTKKKILIKTKKRAKVAFF